MSIEEAFNARLVALTEKFGVLKVEHTVFAGRGTYNSQVLCAHVRVIDFRDTDAPAHHLRGL